MNEPDVFDRQHADEYPENEGGITCKHCGAECYWQEVITKDGTPRVRLYEDGHRHVCKPSADDFEDLTK